LRAVFVKWQYPWAVRVKSRKKQEEEKKKREVKSKVVKGGKVE
jgi:hypothetical protein